jgi:hypothetical protein
VIFTAGFPIQCQKRIQASPMPLPSTLLNSTLERYSVGGGAHLYITKCVTCHPPRYCLLQGTVSVIPACTTTTVSHTIWCASSVSVCCAGVWGVGQSCATIVVASSSSSYTASRGLCSSFSTLKKYE